MVGPRELPLVEFDDMSIAAVHLLQGVVYVDETRTWELVLQHQTRLDNYFNRIGLRLVVDSLEGFAFLRQLDDSEMAPLRGYDSLPKLFRRKRLSYDATLACVLLREELRRYEEEQVDHERCVVAMSDLLEQWKVFFPAAQDDVKLRRSLSSALGTLEELKFIREFSEDPQEWEIRRILKARLPVAELERLWVDLQAAAASRGKGAGAE